MIRGDRKMIGGAAKMKWAASLFIGGAPLFIGDAAKMKWGATPTVGGAPPTKWGAPQMIGGAPPIVFRDGKIIGVAPLFIGGDGKTAEDAPFFKIAEGNLTVATAPTESSHAEMAGRLRDFPTAPLLATRRDRRANAGAEKIFAGAINLPQPSVTR